jgi:hypothetical protein
LSQLIAALDGHFAANDVSPADAGNWRELKRQLIRMRDGLVLILTTLEWSAAGLPLTDERRKLEHYTAFAFGAVEKPEMD